MGGGGIGVYVRDRYSVNILASSDTLFDNKPEYLILEINLSHTKLLFAVIYLMLPTLLTSSNASLPTYLTSPQ